MPTVKEREQEIVKSQLIQNVRDLIKCMNAERNLNIAIVEDETKETTFEFSLEYPPYEGSRQKFQRRVSNLEIEEFIENVMSNIEKIIGCKYTRGEDLIFIYDLTDDNRRINITEDYSYSYGSKISVYKKIHINMPFVEDKGR